MIPPNDNVENEEELEIATAQIPHELQVPIRIPPPQLRPPKMISPKDSVENGEVLILTAARISVPPNPIHIPPPQLKPPILAHQAYQYLNTYYPNMDSYLMTNYSYRGFNIYRKQ